MIYDAEVEVTCDGRNCYESTRIQLAWKYRSMSESSGFYDASDEDVEKRLSREEWIVREGKHYCSESCADDREKD